MDSVLDQMTATDTVVVAYADPAHELGWAAIHGPEAEGAVDIPSVAGPELRGCPSANWPRTYPKLRVEKLPHAC